MDRRWTITGLVVALVAGALVTAFLNTLEPRAVDLVAAGAILLVAVVVVISCYRERRR